MRCVSCGDLNPRGNAFCRQCGARLVRVAGSPVNRQRAPLWPHLSTLILIAVAIVVIVGAAFGALISSRGSAALSFRETSVPVGTDTATPNATQIALQATLAPQATDTPIPTQAPVATPTPTEQYMLAVLEIGNIVSPDAPLVGEFQQALINLKTMRHANGKQLSNMAVETHNLMAQRGVDESYLSILQHVYASFPANYPDRSKDSCAAEFAVYETLRTGGMSP